MTKAKQLTPHSALFIINSRTCTMRSGSKIRRTYSIVIASQNGVHLLLPRSGEAHMPALSRAVGAFPESTICFPSYAFPCIDELCNLLGNVSPPLKPLILPSQHHLVSLFCLGAPHTFGMHRPVLTFLTLVTLKSCVIVLLMSDHIMQSLPGCLQGLGSKNVKS